jgi:hypothetical protein
MIIVELSRAKWPPPQTCKIYNAKRGSVDGVTCDGKAESGIFAMGEEHVPVSSS